LLLAGCASTRRQDDYVAQIIAETLGEVPEKPAVPGRGPSASKPAAEKPAAETPAAASEAAPAVSPAIQAPPTPAQTAARERGWLGFGKPGPVTIQPETVLWITVEEDPSLNGRYVVNAQGDIDFGYAGLVLLRDMTVEQAESRLRQSLEGRYLTKATLTARVAKASYDRVAVIGAVTAPGEVRIGPGTSISLNDLLRRAGGIRSETGTNRIKLVREGLLSPFGPAAEGEFYTLDADGGGMVVPEVYLRNNDLVYVFAYDPARASVSGKTILLLGEVPRRGVIEFSDSEPCTLMYLLFKIGGLPRFAKATRVRIVRRDSAGVETRIVANAQKLLSEGNPDDDVPLQPGDRVIVPAKKFTFF
jgi:protein involved in polysaccharide export with SLBB domain